MTAKSFLLAAVSGLALLWQVPAQAEAIEGHLTSAGIEQVEVAGRDVAYVVATINQPSVCNDCPQADQVFAAPLDSPFGQRLARMAEAALRERQRVAIVLRGCDQNFFGRRRIVSFVVSPAGMNIGFGH